MLTNSRRTSSIYTISKCFCAVISKDKFTELITINPPLNTTLINRIKMYCDEGFKNASVMLKNVPYFRNLNGFSLRKIYHKLREIHPQRGDLALRAGEISDKIFFVK